MSLRSPFIQQALTVALTLPHVGWILGLTALVGTVLAVRA
jgi:hypothetical protein